MPDAATHFPPAAGRSRRGRAIVLSSALAITLAVFPPSALQAQSPTTTAKPQPVIVKPGQPIPPIQSPPQSQPVPPVQKSPQLPPLGPMQRIDPGKIRLPPVLLAPVALLMPAAPLYVGGYARIGVRVNAAGLTFDDLAFSVVEGPKGGSLSDSRDATFNPAQPETMLLAGYQPGTYTLRASRRSDGSVLAEAPFQVSVASPGGEGPPVVVQGLGASMASGAAWGGSPAGLQNVSTTPALGTRRLAVILADTSEQRFPADPATINAIKTDLRNNIIDGVTSGGTLRSVRRFYRESSRNLMDLSLDIYGPYNLTGDWASMGAGAGLGGHAQAAITAADADINYNNYDTIIVVSQSVGAIGAPGAKFAWPTASICSWGGWATGEGTMTKGVIQFPVDWTARDGRQVFQTMSHELGHNLCLGDQYTPEVPGRNPGAWEMMDADGALPNFSLAHKMRLGWVDPAWVRGFNFATGATPVDQTVTLQPVNQGAPPAGRFVGVEVRVTDGLNYYFEYRKDTPSQIADAALPANDRIVGTDVRSGAYEAPILRPDVLLMSPDGDGDGQVLAAGQNYREDDNSDPIYPVEFRADAMAITGTTADLRIRYGVNDKPDPSIRPWGAPGWQTQDIEVRNARNMADPAWRNVPWAGNPNTVIARIKNNGALGAPGVRVNFFVKNYNVGGAPEYPLGFDIQDVPAGGVVEFSTNWTPPSEGHWCIVVRIPLYTRPGATPVTEMTELNNTAQSNYDRFISATASPAERMISQIEVGNPFDRQTRVYITPGQTNPLYRTYLEHKWLDLGPNETRKVKVMFEYAGMTPSGFTVDPKDKQMFEQTMRRPNRVQLASYAVNPYDPTGHNLVRLGGADVEVATGRKTIFQRFDVGDGYVAGAVATSDGKPVPDSQVILTVTEGGKKRNVVAKTSNGAFRVSLGAPSGTAQAYFVPPQGYGDAYSSIATFGRQ